MRQRKIKDIENKLLDYNDLIISSPKDMQGKWREAFNSVERLYVEIGCGKGRFISELAEKNPEDGFIAIEGFSSVIIRAVEKIRKNELSNARFVQEFVNDLGIWFSPEEVDGIYLNFSDPWPKRKNAKRRLTYRDRLEQYAKALTPGGFLRFKTDNDEFFQFTLEEIQEYNDRRNRTDGEGVFDIVALTNDLHDSQWRNISPMTEYENKFSQTGKTINFVELRKS